MKLNRARQRFKNDSTEQTTKIVFQTSSDTMALQANRKQISNILANQKPKRFDLIDHDKDIQWRFEF